jgi:hypothetical protein
MRGLLPFATLAAIGTLAFASCAGTGGVATSLSRLLAEAPHDTPARLWLAGDRIVAAAAPLGPGSLPPAVRTSLDAVAPAGTTTFVGREWGHRGDGFRIEKHYSEPDHSRSALIAADGSVLERAHTLPLAEVPQNVLATALRTGPTIEAAWMVSGPVAEEYWSFVVRDRSGRVFAVRVGLGGEPLGRLRRLGAQIEA